VPIHSHAAKLAAATAQPAPRDRNAPRKIRLTLRARARARYGSETLPQGGRCAQGRTGGRRPSLRLANLTVVELEASGSLRSAGRTMPVCSQEQVALRAADEQPEAAPQALQSLSSVRLTRRSPLQVGTGPQSGAGPLEFGPRPAPSRAGLAQTAHSPAPCGRLLAPDAPAADGARSRPDRSSWLRSPESLGSGSRAHLLPGSEPLRADGLHQPIPAFGPR
jgi:hypothetical protein